MQSKFQYRGYAISSAGQDFIAEPIEPDGTDFEIASRNVNRLLLAIDELWSSLDEIRDLMQLMPAPSWFQTWIDDGATGRIQVFTEARV